MKRQSTAKMFMHFIERKREDQKGGGPRPFYTTTELSVFVCNGIATRLKNGHASDIVAVVQRVGGKSAKTLLTKKPLLGVLSEFVAFVQGATDETLYQSIHPTKRKALTENLQVSKRKKTSA